MFYPVLRSLLFAVLFSIVTAHSRSLDLPVQFDERAQKSPRKVDVHAHYYTPFYLQSLKDAGYSAIDLVPYIPAWNITTQLAYMNKNGIDKTILSITSPGTFLKANDTAQALAVTHDVNDYASALKKKYPSRIGFFASIPLPLIQESITEIDRALDKLHADGIALLSNHHGVYLGNPLLAPVLAHLNKRKAIVFVHPTTPCIKQYLDSCPAGSNPDPLRDAPLQDSYITPMMEYFYDSTRSFVDLLLTGTAAAQPQIRWIVTHSGLALPSVLDRAAQFSVYDFPNLTGRKVVPITPDQIRALFKRSFWFDLAGMSVPNLVLDVLRWSSEEKILYGSDTPFTDLAGTNEMDQEGRLGKLFDQKVVAGIVGGNAARLLGL
ncbi:MAG: hypothetical protein Q9190_003499 [Brigantiaea leucoxantha]